MRCFGSAAVIVTLLLGTATGRAADGAKVDLRPFNVTVRVFDPMKGLASGRDYVLPVDSPDEEHAIASTTANAASFTTTVEGGKPLSVASTCVKVEPRP